MLLAPGAAFAQASNARYCLGGVCETSCVRDVCLYISANESFGLVEAQNGSDLPVGIRIEFQQLVNVTPYPRQPIRAVIPAGRSRQIVKLSVQSPRVPFRFPFSWSFTYGDPTATHYAAARYRLPFGGRQKRVLTQGQNGKFTHKGTSAYSYDFGMPVGTPILAARRVASRRCTTAIPGRACRPSSSTRRTPSRFCTRTEPSQRTRTSIPARACVRACS